MGNESRFDLDALPREVLMKVPLVDLRASYEPIKAELFESFEKILDGMQLFLGPNVQAFEKEFAEYCQADHGVAVSNGTDALFVALLACGIGPGDEVIVPSHTFFATTEAIIHTGATPVMVDIEPRRMTIDPTKIAEAVNPRTRAIVPVHLYGHPADMDPILQIARQHDLRVIEDAAQAHGARYKGRRCGSMGDAASFSFYFTKNLGAFGEAGFVCTPHADIAEKVRLYRHHGHASKFEHALVGYNYPMDELQAAILRIKLRRLEENNANRLRIAQKYDDILAGTHIQTLIPGDDCDCVFHLYPIRLNHRDELQNYLDKHEIGTGIHYKIPGHLQPALKNHSHRIADMTETEAACRTLLSLPIYPEMTDDQIDFVAGHVRDFCLDRTTAGSSGTR
jgi:dTDP-4-amino-4,6-dideoxygalactose transaminase